MIEISFNSMSLKVTSKFMRKARELDSLLNKIRRGFFQTIP
jgi:hypothetical protein